MVKVAHTVFALPFALTGMFLGARELGARAFFRKPVDAAALLDSIEWVTRKDKPA